MKHTLLAIVITFIISCKKDLQPITNTNDPESVNEGWDKDWNPYGTGISWYGSDEFHTVQNCTCKRMVCYPHGDSVNRSQNKTNTEQINRPPWKNIPKLDSAYLTNLFKKFRR